MRIAETLGKSLKEVMELDVLEIQMWYAWFSLQHKQQQEAMKSGGKATNNHRISR